MFSLDKIVISSVNEVFTVNANRGHEFNMVDRKTYGLSFTENGKIIYYHNGKEYISDPKHAVIIPKGADYSLKCIKTGAFPLINFESLNFKEKEFITLPVHGIQDYVQQYNKMKQLSLNEHSNAICMSIMYSIINQLYEDSLMKTNRLYPAIKYIDNHLNEEITNSLLADILNISDVYLRKLFIKYYGVTPKQYIIYFRIKKAKHLLTESNKSISDICFLCGFNDIYHFSRIFKSKTGLSPSEYKNQFRAYKL